MCDNAVLSKSAYHATVLPECVILARAESSTTAVSSLRSARLKISFSGRVSVARSLSSRAIWKRRRRASAGGMDGNASSPLFPSLRSPYIPPGMTCSFPREEERLPSGQPAFVTVPPSFPFLLLPIYFLPLPAFSKSAVRRAGRGCLLGVMAVRSPFPILVELCGRLGERIWRRCSSRRIMTHGWEPLG